MTDDAPVLRRELEAMHAALTHSVDGTPRAVVPRRMLERALGEIKRLREVVAKEPPDAKPVVARVMAQRAESKQALYSRIARAMEREKRLVAALEFYAAAPTELTPGQLARDVLDKMRRAQKSAEKCS